jgi:hypothetical protein
VPEPPLVNVTLDELSEILGGCFALGVRVVDNEMVPANPFRLVSVIVEFPVCPLPIEISVPATVVPIVNVGVGAGV